jgi:cobalamin biosynthesis protein CobT
MNPKTLIAIAIAALLVFAGGAAAMPGQATGADAADEHQPDDPGSNVADETGDDSNETDADDARDENATDGPPTEIPDEAPDHVSQIHDFIREKLDGNLTGQELGEAISGLMGNGDAALANGQADSAGEQSEDASANSEDARTNAGPVGDLPEQAADHVIGIHDAIQSFLNGDGDGDLGNEVSNPAG